MLTMQELYGGGDEVTREKFDGQPIDLERLPINTDLREKLQKISDYLCDKYGYLEPKDWENEKEIRATWPSLVTELKCQLGSEFEIIDEMGKDWSRTT